MATTITMTDLHRYPRVTKKRPPPLPNVRVEELFRKYSLDKAQLLNNDPTDTAEFGQTNSLAVPVTTAEESDYENVRKPAPRTKIKVVEQQRTAQAQSDQTQLLNDDHTGTEVSQTDFLAIPTTATEESDYENVRKPAPRTKIKVAEQQPQSAATQTNGEEQFQDQMKRSRPVRQDDLSHPGKVLLSSGNLPSPLSYPNIPQKEMQVKVEISALNSNPSKPQNETQTQIVTPLMVIRNETKAETVTPFQNEIKPQTITPLTASREKTQSQTPTSLSVPRNELQAQTFTPLPAPRSETQTQLQIETPIHASQNEQAQTVISLPRPVNRNEPYPAPRPRNGKQKMHDLTRPPFTPNSIIINSPQPVIEDFQSKLTTPIPKPRSSQPMPFVPRPPIITPRKQFEQTEERVVTDVIIKEPGIRRPPQKQFEVAEQEQVRRRPPRKQFEGTEEQVRSNVKEIVIRKPRKQSEEAEQEQLRRRQPRKQVEEAEQEQVRRRPPRKQFEGTEEQVRSNVKEIGIRKPPQKWSEEAEQDQVRRRPPRKQLQEKVKSNAKELGIKRPARKPFKEAEERVRNKVGPRRAPPPASINDTQNGKLFKQRQQKRPINDKDPGVRRVPPTPPASGGSINNATSSPPLLREPIEPNTSSEDDSRSPVREVQQRGPFNTDGQERTVDTAVQPQKRPVVRATIKKQQISSAVLLELQTNLNIGPRKYIDQIQ